MKLIRNPNVNVLYGGHIWMIARRSSHGWSSSCVMSKSWTTSYSTGFPIPAIFRRPPAMGCFFSEAWSQNMVRSHRGDGNMVAESWREGWRTVRKNLPEF